MSIAQEIKLQIENHYKGSVINHDKLANHLLNNRMDYSQPLRSSYVCFDKPVQEALPLILFYGDKSLLIITFSGISVGKSED